MLDECRMAARHTPKNTPPVSARPIRNALPDGRIASTNAAGSSTSHFDALRIPAGMASGYIISATSANAAPKRAAARFGVQRVEVVIDRILTGARDPRFLTVRRYPRRRHGEGTRITKRGMRRAET